ncbi:unnamed protein product [Clonostachys rosea f. rosea IK726]|uniref:Tat pathway signal sequence n=2 Tax=Bionectria ochroleuca TaxID=29856 RepID=A0A0B7KGB1_BIOOC|nr:unnamed protein product [Clonostachys rosea f. rosea IK726]
MPKEDCLHEPLINESNDSNEDRFLPARESGGIYHDHGIKNYNFLYKVSITSLVLILAIVSMLLLRMEMQFHHKVDQTCASHTASWSPLLRDTSITYKSHTFDGSFMNENIYRQQGSPEVDAAWEALGVNSRAGIISREDGLASGLDSSFVQRADKYGGGFLVNVEGMHHLHCLNLLRKSLYFNYDHYKHLGQHAFKNEEPILRRHVTHCLDTIRQVLMCNVDTGVLGQVWANPNNPTAFPDFNTKHVCKNYESVRKWAESIQAPPYDQVPEDFLETPSSEDILPAIP